MKIVVIGLGYVGLPLAIELAKHYDTWGLDIDEGRVAELRRGYDRTGEVEREKLSASELTYTTRADECPKAEAYIVTVPTPIDADKQPDLGAVIGATRTVAAMLDPTLRPVVVYESTVYPGVTETICGPLIEAAGHVRGRDFVLGYSPERINPGDREHTVDRIVKVVAGEDAETLERVAAIYTPVTSAGVFRAASIKAAEAAKVIENAQRDINIAFVNEITQIFAKLDLSIWDVLAAAGTKWNFLPFSPGLVGGHCIGVDPYYLSYQAQQLGHDPQVILAGRDTNDGFGGWVADQVHTRAGRPGRVLVLGLTFKEDVPDLRNSRVIDVIGGLRERGHEVTVHDPLANPAEARHEYGLDLETGPVRGCYDIVIGAVAHRAYKQLGESDLRALVAEDGLLVDLKAIWPRETMGALGRRFWTL